MPACARVVLACTKVYRLDVGRTREKVRGIELIDQPLEPKRSVTEVTTKLGTLQ